MKLSPGPFKVCIEFQQKGLVSNDRYKIIYFDPPYEIRGQQFFCFLSSIKLLIAFTNKNYL